VIGHNAQRKAKRLHGGQGPGEPLEWLLGENEKAFGVAHARGFVVAVALSRSGWRDNG